jgi:outer membrane protein
MSCHEYAREARVCLAVLMFGTALSQVSAAQTPDTSGRRIRLSDAIAEARQSSLQSVQAENQISTARTEERAAYASFLPNVTVNVSSGVSNSFGSSGGGGGGGTIATGTGTTTDPTQVSGGGGGGSSLANSFRTNTSVTASLTVFDGGRRIFETRAARADLVAAEAGLTSQQFNTSLSVTQAFYDGLAAREALQAAQAQLVLADSTQRIANLRLRVRMVTLSDSLRAVIQVAQARVAVATALTNLANANAALTRFTGSRDVVTADPADTIGRGVIQLDTAVLRQYAESSPAVVQAAEQQRAATEQQRAARAAFLPQVDASYTFSGSGRDPFLGVANPYAYGNRLNLSISLPILDQFQREATLSRAQIAAQNASAGASDVRLAARQQLTQAVGAMQLAERRITEQTAAMRAAEEDIRQQLDRYRLGEATIVDVLTSESELSTAETALIQARFDFRVARAQIEAVIGRPL